MTKPPRSATKATILRSITSMFERTSSRELQVTALFNFYSLLLSHNARISRRLERQRKTVGLIHWLCNGATHSLKTLNIVRSFALFRHLQVQPVVHRYSRKTLLAFDSLKIFHATAALLHKQHIFQIPNNTSHRI